MGRLAGPVSRATQTEYAHMIREIELAHSAFLALAKGHVRLNRSRPLTFFSHARRRSNLYDCLSLTQAGRTELSRAKVSEADKDYIQGAQKTGVMR